MHQIRSLLKLATRRLEMGSFLNQAHLAAIALAIVALLLMIADRLGSRSFTPWQWVVPILLVGGGAVAFARWRARRRSELQVAVAVDDRLDLREKLSTALQCEGRQDPFAQAAIEDAVKVAGDRRTHERTSRSFKVAAPKGWWMSPLIVLAVIMVSMLSPLDLFSSEEKEQQDSEIIRAQQQAAESVEAVVQEIENNPQLTDSLEDLLGELTEDAFDADMALNPDQVKRDALKKVNEISKRLEEIISGEKGKTAAALNESLRALKPPKDGPASELAEKLAAGDFAGAQEALQKMMEELQKGEMSPQEQQAAAEQLQALADQLQQLADQQQSLQNALQQAGMNPQLINNPQALQQAIQNNPNLNQQQRQQLQQMAQAQQAASQACQGLGQACQKMAQSLGQGGQMGQMGQAGQQMSQQLSQMEQMQMMLQQAQAAANQAMGQCQGLGQGLGQCQGQGQGGMGGRGQGRGGKAPIAPTPWGKKTVRAPVHSNPEGDIIARMLIEDGFQIVGESKKTAKQIAADMIEGFDEAQLEEPVPRKYEEANQHYFGELKKLTEAQDVAVPDAEAKPNPE